MSNKKQTLEEAAESNFDKKTSMIPVPTSYWMDSKLLQIQNFEEGAKWQQNKMYNEEEVLELVWKYETRKTSTVGHHNVKEWFEQFKK